jgi:undecaprenyl-diphosphatase
VDRSVRFPFVSVFEAIVLGIVQGLTEFLPISSSGHLRIVPAFAGWEDPGAVFTAVIQLGTMAAVLLYFRHQLVAIAVTWVRSLGDRSLRAEPDARMGWYLIVGTIPILVFGFTFRDQIETGVRNLYLIGTTLIVLGLVLLAADRLATHVRTVEQLTFRDGIVVGLAQALALIPGVSRSGATMTAGLFFGLTREAAARFSFLLSVPAVVLSGLYGLRDFADADQTTVGALDLLVGTVTSFAVGYLSIAFLLRYLHNHSMLVFVIYRVALGIVVLVLVSNGVIE